MPWPFPPVLGVANFVIHIVQEHFLLYFVNVFQFFFFYLFIYFFFFAVSVCRKRWLQIGQYIMFCFVCFKDMYICISYALMCYYCT